MSVTNYKQYVSDTLAFARSLIIKSNSSIIGINQHIQDLGHTLSSDPRTWRYYQNISGEYHFLDRPMGVVSLDTLQLIPFTKENLSQHYVTRENYKPGTRFYNELVEKYPDQELLIRGIIDPVNIEDAIAAEDFSILYYDPRYVESNETNLINALQKRITEFSIRWDNPSYAVTEDLYTAASLAVLFGRIPGWLMNIRLANCKTKQVHSFHMREYLKSHGRLDRYFDYLTKEQALWLYRNINYIERNAGKQDTFEWLAENIITKRGLGLAEFDQKHNLSELVDNLKPEPEFLRKALNRYHRSRRNEEHSLQEVLLKERPLAVRNEYDEPRVLTEDKTLIQNSARSTHPTKMLESAIIDWSESGSVLKAEFLLNHWAYWSYIDKYIATIRVNNPRTNTTLELTAKDAFILFLYCYNKSVGVTLTELPYFVAKFIRKTKTPSFAELRNITDRQYVSDEMVERFSNYRFRENKVLSAYQFVNDVTELYSDERIHREVYSLQENFRARGQHQGLADHLYKDVEMLFNPVIEYDTWLFQKGVFIHDLSPAEYSNLAKQLLEESTGYELDTTTSLFSIQRAMIAIMTQLSSYSIQFVNESNENPILFWTWTAIRFNPPEIEASTRDKIRLLSNIPKDVYHTGVSGLSVFPEKIRAINASGKTNVTIPQTTLTLGKGLRKDFIRIPTARMYVNTINIVEM